MHCPPPTSTLFPYTTLFRSRHGGDLQGVKKNLDYIRDRGMTAIWFTPILENDMPPEYGAYHGYAATDMYRADRRFGSNEEYLELIDTAHSMGMKVIKIGRA